MIKGSISRDPRLRFATTGGTVAATRFQPPQSGAETTHPVILIATPYRKDDWITFGSWHPSIKYFARQGLEVVVADVPGTGASTGEPDPFARSDGAHLATIVEALAEKDWTNGNVGMFGLSYGAWTQYATAAHDPKGLKALVPLSATPNCYASSYTGGLFNPLKRAAWATEFHARQLLPPVVRDGGHWKQTWHDRCNRRADRHPWLFRFIDHAERDEFWERRRVSPDEVDVPALAACGTRDVHTAAMVPFIDSVDAKTRLIVGPWRHRMPHRGREVTLGFRRLAADWFDTYLREDPEQPNGPTDELPPIACRIEHEGGWTPAGTWQALSHWPTAESEAPQSLCVTTQGLAQETSEAYQPVRIPYEPDGTAGIESLQRVGRVANYGVDTNADDARSIACESESLETPLKVTGSPSAILHIESAAPRTAVAARLVDVAPDGTSRLVTNGWTNVGSNGSHTDSEASAEGIRRAEVALNPTAHRFEPGHQIRLAIAATHFPRMFPPNGTETLTLHSTPEQPSKVHLPRTEQAVSTSGDVDDWFLKPETEITPERQHTRNEQSQWTVTRDHTARRGTLQTESTKKVDPPVGGTLEWDRTITAEVPEENPREAVIETDVAATLEHAVGTVSVTAFSRVSRRQATLTSQMSVDGSVRFDEHWETSH